MIVVIKKIFLSYISVAVFLWLETKRWKFISSYWMLSIGRADCNLSCHFGMASHEHCCRLIFFSFFYEGTELATWKESVWYCRKLDNIITCRACRATNPDVLVLILFLSLVIVLGSWTMCPQVSIHDTENIFCHRPQITNGAVGEKSFITGICCGEHKVLFNTFASRYGLWNSTLSYPLPSPASYWIKWRV